MFRQNPCCCFRPMLQFERCLCMDPEYELINSASSAEVYHREDFLVCYIYNHTEFCFFH